MTRLNDLQLVLLSAAARRDDGSLLPPPDHLAEQSTRIRKVILPLIKQGLVEETPTKDVHKVWREDGDNRFTLIITDASRERIGVDAGNGDTAPPSSVPEPGASKSD